MANFAKQLEKAIEDKFDAAIRSTVKRAVTRAYDSILMSDVSSSRDINWSGYFHANQDILIGTGQQPQLRPPKREYSSDPVETIGIYRQLISRRRDEELNQLDKQFDYGLQKVNVAKNVSISTAVPYAEDVGFSEGEGNQIYATARDEAKQVI